jgi:WD40 repeat protein
LIHLWSIDQDKPIYSFEKDAHSSKTIISSNNNIDYVRQLVINKEGTRFYSCSDDKSIKIWNMNTKSHVKTIQNAHDSSIYCISSTKDEKYLLSGGADKSIKIWLIKDDTLTLEFTYSNAHKGNFCIKLNYNRISI